MTRRWMQLCGIPALCLLPCALRAQDQPLSVRGTFSTGYYATSTRSETKQSLSFIPVGLRFDITGYYLTPDLVYFSAQPELNAGPQASEAGFQGGNGIRLRMTFLRKLVPVTFRYSNVQVEDVYFGSLSQISGYSLKNRNKDLGLTLELRPKSLPSAVVDWGTDSVNSTSGTAGISDYFSRGNHVNVDTSYERSAWVMQGFFHRQEQDSDLLAPIDGGAQVGSLRQTVLQAQGSVRRGFLGDSELYLDGGRQSTSSLLFTLPIDLTTHSFSANLRLRQRHRWKTSLRASYVSNLASQLLAQAASSLSGAGSVAADEYVLAPFSRGISNLNLTGLTFVALPYGFGLNGSVERNQLYSSDLNSPFDASYFTTSAGVTYTKGTHWGGVSAEYAREYGVGSVTGQTGRIQGQNYRAGIQRGGSGRLHMDLTVRGTNQTIRNAQPLTNNSFATEGTVGERLFGDLSARLGGGWQWNSIVNSANEFRTNGYTARAGIDHPRFQVNGSLNNSLGSSLPFYSDILGGLGVDSILLTPLQKIPSDYRAQSLSLHATPVRRLELSAMWTRSKQHLAGRLNNDFELLNVFVTYRFRRLQLEAGYVRSNQAFILYPVVLRERLYVRVVRSARIL